METYLCEGDVRTFESRATTGQYPLHTVVTAGP